MFVSLVPIPDANYKFLINSGSSDCMMAKVFWLGFGQSEKGIVGICDFDNLIHHSIGRRLLCVLEALAVARHNVIVRGSFLLDVKFLER